MASWFRVTTGACLVAVCGCSGEESQKPPLQVVPGGGVTVEPAGGLFEGQVSVKLSAKGGSEVHYTLDGSLPTPSSPVYTAPLVLTETTQLRAQAFEGQQPVEAGTGAVFIARAFDVSSDLPLIVIDGYARGKPDQKNGGSWVTQDAAVVVVTPKDGTARLSSDASLAARAGYHVRGQSSASFEKAPYKVEFWDETNDDVDLPLLGMPAESDWALIGPYEDRSLLRNAFAFELGRQLGLKAPRFEFAEVYINQDGGPLQPGDYEGLYMVTETIKNSKSRLDLKELDETETEVSKISGGYIFKFDWAAAEEPLIECQGAPAVQHAFGQCSNEGAEQFPAVDCSSGGGSGGGAGGGFGGGGFGGGQGGSGVGSGANSMATCWADLEVVDPDPLNAAQEDYLTSYITELNDALHSSPIGNYADYIDVPSFVDTLILNELLRNGDAYVRSVYFYKDRDAKIVAGPLWDFNLTMADGGATFCNSSPVGFAYEFRQGSNDWFQRLIGDADFSDRVRARWGALRTDTLSQDNLENLIAALAQPLSNAAARDFERWPVCDVAMGIFAVPEGQTWEDQLQVIRDYLKARAEWLDSQW